MSEPQSTSWRAYRGGRFARLAQLLMTRYVDRFHPAAMIADFLDEPEILEAFRLINGAAGIAEAVIRWFGPIRATSDGFARNPDYRGPTPIEILKPLRSARPREQRMALQYLVHASAPAGQAPLLTPEPDDEAKAIRAWGERTPWVRRFSSEWRAFSEAMLPFYVDMHYLDPQEVFHLTRIRGLPLTRPLRDRRGVVDRLPIDDVDDRDVADALLGSLVRNIQGAVRAYALFKLWLHASDNPFDPEPLGDSILESDPNAEPHPSDRRLEVARDPELADHPATAWRAKDDLVALMVRSLYPDPPGPILAILIGIKNVMAALITADPTFVLRNSTRDTLSAFVLGRAWMVPVADTLRGAAAFTASSENARQWYLQGGAISTLLETAAEDSYDAEPLLASLTVTSRLKRFTRACRRAYLLVVAPARALEAGTRIMQFRRMRAGGATARQAALASRAVATDFANRGAANDPITWLIRTTVFLNAAIQGLNETRKVALTRSGMGGKTRFWGTKSAKFWGAGLLGLTTLSALGWYHSTSTRENLARYEALTTYHKSAYVHFTGVESLRGHLRVPVPFEVGFLFQKVPEMAFDAVANLDTSDTDPVSPGILPPTAQHILQTSFLLSGLPVPSALAPILDHLRNRNFFGIEIVPWYMMGRPPVARHFRSTPRTYVVVGEWLDLSPLVVRHYLESYGGNLARNALAAVEPLVWDEDRYGPRAFPSGVLRATGLGAFSTAPFASRTRWADDYYRLAERVGHACYMGRQLVARRADTQARAAFVAENGALLSLCSWKTAGDRLLREFGPRIHGQGFANPGLSREHKELFIQGAYARRDDVLRRAYLTGRERLLQEP